MCTFSSRSITHLCFSFPLPFDEYSYRWADRILFPFNFPGVQIKGGGRVYVDFIALSDL